MLRNTLKAATGLLTVLTVIGSSLLATAAHATEPTAKDKKGQVAAAAVKAPASTSATITLTGRIRNEEGQPLAAATVYLQGTATAVTTNEEGIFTLEVPAEGKKTLRYGYGGYQDRDVIVTSSAPFTMSLHPTAETVEQRNDK